MKVGLAKLLAFPPFCYAYIYINFTLKAKTSPVYFVLSAIPKGRDLL